MGLCGFIRPVLCDICQEYSELLLTQFFPRDFPHNIHVKRPTDSNQFSILMS